jgi:hypothetical protein
MPTNQTSFASFVVPVLPAAGSQNPLPHGGPVPRSMTSSIMLCRQVRDAGSSTCSRARRRAPQHAAARILDPGDERRLHAVAAVAERRVRRGELGGHDFGGPR